MGKAWDPGTTQALRALRGQGSRWPGAQRAEPSSAWAKAPPTTEGLLGGGFRGTCSQSAPVFPRRAPQVAAQPPHPTPGPEAVRAGPKGSHQSYTLGFQVWFCLKKKTGAPERGNPRVLPSQAPGWGTGHCPLGRGRGQSLCFSQGLPHARHCLLLRAQSSHCGPKDICYMAVSRLQNLDPIPYPTMGACHPTTCRMQWDSQ